MLIRPVPKDGEVPSGWEQFAHRRKPPKMFRVADGTDVWEEGPGVYKKVVVEASDLT